MDYYPDAYASNNRFRVPEQNSYIRMFNASPSSPSLDVYANGTLIVKNIPYNQFSQYIPLPPGKYKLTIYESGKNENPILDTEAFVTKNSVFNFAIIGIYPNIELYPIPEPAAKQNFGRPCIRFINLSPASTPVNLILTDGTTVFTNVAYKYITDYACMSAGSYAFLITSYNTNQVLLKIPNVNLLSNTYYTIYLTGLSSGDPPLKALVVYEPR